MSSKDVGGPGQGPTIQVLGPNGEPGAARPRPVRPGVAGKGRLGKGRARLVQLLITSVGVLTLLLSGSVVAVAASATGSTSPSDWSQVGWSTVTDRFQACVEAGRGLGTIGCVLGIGTMRLTAAENDGWTTVERQRRRVYVVETVGGVRTAPVTHRPSPKPAVTSPTKPGGSSESPGTGAGPAPTCRPVPVGDDTPVTRTSTGPCPVTQPAGVRPGGD